MRVFDKTVQQILNERLTKLEGHFEADVMFYYGEIASYSPKAFLEVVEGLRADSPQKNRIVIILNTPGGSAEVVEKLVEIVRHHYSEVYFVVPDVAMSAGTVFCMSGDKIFMDYSSSLGPIDPQVWNGKEWVPALGYLDQVQKLLDKAKKNELSDAELLILQNQDLATLSQYEQQKELTISLLKKWLVQYKFKNWATHATDPIKKGQPVTAEEKIQRAAQIAERLSNNTEWHTHQRMISARTLTQDVGLKIEDYSDDSGLREFITQYNDLITEYIRRFKYEVFLHSRNFF